jgi:hypothetical protein
MRIFLKIRLQVSVKCEMIWQMRQFYGSVCRRAVPRVPALNSCAIGLTPGCSSPQQFTRPRCQSFTLRELFHSQTLQIGCAFKAKLTISDLSITMIRFSRMLESLASGSAPLAGGDQTNVDFRVGVVSFRNRRLSGIHVFELNKRLCQFRQLTPNLGRFND